MSKYTSMATTLNTYADCRMLTLELEFHKLERAQMIELAHYCAQQIHDLFSGDVYAIWHSHGRRCSYEKLIDKLLNERSYCDFSFEADFCSECVYDRKSAAEFERKRTFLANTSAEVPYCSTDYLEYFVDHFSNIHDSNDIKTAIVSTSVLPGKYFRSKWFNYDISSSFDAVCHANDPERFKGSYTMQVALMSLGTNAEEMADYFKKVLTSAAQIANTVSGRVLLSPFTAVSYTSPHMCYFGEVDATKVVSTAETEAYYSVEDWYRYLYFCGAEWFNLLTPRQMSHLSNFPDLCEAQNNVAVEKMANGSVAIGSKKPITEFEPLDLMPIRKLLYPALYPGASAIPLDVLLNPCLYAFMAKFRPQWEMIPIFEDEISIEEKYLRFSTKKY